MSRAMLHEIATAKMQLGIYSEAEQLFRQYIEAARGQDNDIAFVVALQNIGVCLKKQGRYQEAKTWYEKALDLSTKLGLQKQQADNISSD